MFAEMLLMADIPFLLMLVFWGGRGSVPVSQKQHFRGYYGQQKEERSGKVTVHKWKSYLEKTSIGSKPNATWRNQDKFTLLHSNTKMYIISTCLLV